LITTATPAEQQKKGNMTDEPNWADQNYVVQDRDGDYLQRIESVNWDTVKFQFHWTHKRSEAQVFTTEELWARGDTMCMALQLVKGHAGCSFLVVSPSEQNQQPRKETKQNEDRKIAARGRSTDTTRGAGTKRFPRAD
jgi:hypothetical protein